MTLSLAPMSKQWAEQVAAWHYEPPFDVYDGDELAPTALLDGNHLAILEDGEFVGYVATGQEARVRGGPPEEPGITDVGIGLAPDRVGERRGTKAGELAIEALRIAGHATLRACILESNVRSRRLASGLGFVAGDRFDDHDAARSFVVYVRTLAD